MKQDTLSNIPRLRQAGFSIMEGMITLLVVSVGLLGLAGLQNKGIQFNQVGYMRTQAALVANDIADRMRANWQAALNTDYDIAFGEQAATAPNCSTQNCTQDQLAKYDVEQWKNTMKANLPGGDGSINLNAAIPSVTITVYWDELRANVSGTGCDPQNADDLKCFQLVVR
jgi:type IV pilus assembly protein PilV